MTAQGQLPTRLTGPPRFIGVPGRTASRAAARATGRGRNTEPASPRNLPDSLFTGSPRPRRGPGWRLGTLHFVEPRRAVTPRRSPDVSPAHPALTKKRLSMRTIFRGGSDAGCWFRAPKLIWIKPGIANTRRLPRKQHGRKTMSKHVELGVCVLACTALFAAAPALADEAPRSYVASPDVYKVVAENNQTRVILATWKPGQRDNWHSHPATGVYFVTDCQTRIHTPDGKSTDGNPRAGGAVVQAPIPSHSFENRGSAECRMIIVEQER